VNWGDNSVILNARWDRTNDAGKDWSFSLSYMRHLTDRLRLKLNMGRALRIPSFEEMYIKNNAFLIGNPELKIEKEDSIIPSLEYGGNNLSVKAMVYQSRFKNFIYKKPLSPITYMWDNSDETVKVSGGSLEVKKRLWDFWEARVAVHRRFHIKGPDSPYLEFPKDKLVAGLTYCLHGTVIDLTTVAYSRVSDKVPGFYYTNLTINKRLSPRLKLSFQIKNLTDKDFFYPNGIPGEERSGWLSLRYSF
jgi:iron complex outermembrane receptor protein